MSSLEESIDQENPVRFIDAFVEQAVLYRKRQEINEHIFGTIKRKWGYYYTNLKGLEKVNGEHSLIMLVYNIKRCFKILGVPELTEKLKNWVSPFKKDPAFLLNLIYLRPLEGILFIRLILQNKKCYSYNS